MVFLGIILKKSGLTWLFRELFLKNGDTWLFRENVEKMEIRGFFFC